MPSAEPPPATLEPAPGIITRPALVASRRPRVTLGAWVVLLAVGIYAYAVALDREGFPPVQASFAQVEADYFVDDADRVDADIAQPVIAAFADVDGVDQIRTFTRANRMFAFVEFDSSFTSPEGKALLEAAPQPDLPDGVVLEIDPVDPTKFADTYDLIVTIAGPAGATAAQLEAQAAIATSAFSALDEVTIAESLGLLTEAVNPETGESELRQTSYTRFAGPGDAESTESIGVGVIRNPDADIDTLDFSDAIQDEIDAGLGLGADYEALIGADFASDVRAQLDSLTSNLFFGLIAVAIVSLILIGWRTALLTAAFMATVMLTALTGLWLIGYSLNTITLFGLILTLGLLVDDAIVISESVDASRDEPSGPEPEVGVVRTAVNRVGAASFAGTLSTLTVFAPMAFVGGILGEFIRPIPVTVMITLALSFLLSVTVIPALGRVFILRGKPAGGPVVRGQRNLARALGRLAASTSGNGTRGIATGAGLLLFAAIIIVLAFGAAGRIGFNIFPPTKDSNALQASIDFDDGLTIDEAQELQAEIDRQVLAAMGDTIERYQVIFGSERGSFLFVNLTPIDERSITSRALVDAIEEAAADIEGVRFAASAVDIGPPPDEFPFQVQIRFNEASELAIAQELAADIAATLPGQTLDKATGEETRVVLAFVATEGQIRRVDGERVLEVAANFDTDEVSANLAAAEDLVKDLFPPEDLVARGLGPDALDFDFGFESDNAEDFNSLLVALLVAIGLMLAFLTIQFRSLAQPVLVFLAVPFSFFGVFTLLEQTDNTLSFFVTVGFIALVGVAVNNTILLVDAANQERRDGATPAQAIQVAVERRFRPLVVTTATTVAGLLPLALSDPFWESLCYVLIGGLVSSTVLVLTVFPVLYLMVENARGWVNPRVRRLVGRA